MPFPFPIRPLLALPLLALNLAVAAQTRPQPGATVQLPVVVQGQTLFTVGPETSHTPAAQRARAIEEHVAWLSESLARILDLHLEQGAAATYVVSQRVVVDEVTDEDARSAGARRGELARAHEQALTSAAMDLGHRVRLRTAILYLVLASLALVGLFWLLFRGMAGLNAKLAQWSHPIRIQNVELLATSRVRELLHGAVWLLRALLSLLLLYAYITVLAGLFPSTRAFSLQLIAYILAPLRATVRSALQFLPNLFFLAVIVAVAFYLAKFVKLIFNALGSGALTIPGFYPEWAPPTYNIARFLIAAFALVVAFPYLPGSTSPAFQGVSIFLGALVSLGSTSAVANVVAGTALTYTRAFSLGDRVKVGETVGDVVEKTMLVTRIRTVRNELVAVPNAQVLASEVLNYSREAATRGLILHTSVTIGYATPWRQIHSLLLGAAAATARVLAQPQPFVLQRALNDFFVTYEICVYTDQPLLMVLTYSELHQNIQDKFFEAGVEIMSPHIYGLRDENKAAIPPHYLPPDYTPPPFRVAPIADTPAPGAPAHPAPPGPRPADPV